MKSEYKLVVTLAAGNDLDEVFEYISNSLLAPLSAQNLPDRIENNIKRLCVFPYKCELSRNELLGQKGYRKLIVDSYVALYLIDEESKTVIIARVFYGAMNYEKFL